MTGWRFSYVGIDADVRAHRFFVGQALAAGEVVRLSPGQARQARSVLRLRPGGMLELFDGSGVVAHARITLMDRQNVEALVETVRACDRELPLDLTVGLALIRGERFDLAVQKLTEIGASSIVPLSAQHCVVSYPVGREWGRRAERLRRIAIEAAEQAERVTVLRIAEPVSVDAFLAAHPPESTLALVERSGPDVSPLMDAPTGETAALMVGPEGGWSDAERRQIHASARPVSLGTLILRSETAAIVAAGALMQRAWATRQHEEEG